MACRDAEHIGHRLVVECADGNGRQEVTPWAAHSSWLIGPGEGLDGERLSS